MVTFSKKLSAALLFGAMTFTTLASSLGVSAADDAVVEVEEQVEENNENNENNEDGAVLNTEENGEKLADEKGSSILGSIAKVGVGAALGAGGTKAVEFGLKGAGVLRDENKELEDTKAELEKVKAGRGTVETVPSSNVASSNVGRFVHGMTLRAFGDKKDFDNCHRSLAFWAGVAVTGFLVIASVFMILKDIVSLCKNWHNLKGLKLALAISRVVFDVFPPLGLVVNMVCDFYDELNEENGKRRGDYINDTEQLKSSGSQTPKGSNLQAPKNNSMGGNLINDQTLPLTN